mgnify:CR=1 FL=1
MPRIPEQRMPPITSRFLFVDVSSRRAKQLRLGALPRLEALRPDPETGQRPEVTSKLERVAMEEVEQGLVVFELREARYGPDNRPSNSVLSRSSSARASAASLSC